MKKILTLLLVLVLSFSVLASCGDDEPAITTGGTGETTNTTTTTTEATTTEEETTTEETTTIVTESTPPSENVDISENLVTYPKKIVDGTEVETMDENANIALSGASEVLQIKFKGEDLANSLLDMDMSITDSKLNSTKKVGYAWIVEINGTEYEISTYEIENFIPAAKKIGLSNNFFILNLNLSEAGFKAVKEKNVEYEIKFVIKGTDGDVAYFAELGTVTYTDIMLMISDETRKARGEELYDYSKITPISGGAFNESETFAKLFDGSILTKLFEQTADEESQLTPIVFTTEDAIAVVSYSLVTANDNVKFPTRLPTGWTLYGSTTGTDDTADWVAIDTVTDYVIETEDLENYKEYNFEVSGAAEYSNFKIEFTGTAVQYSELLLFTAAE